VVAERSSPWAHDHQRRNRQRTVNSAATTPATRPRKTITVIGGAAQKTSHPVMVNGTRGRAVVAQPGHQGQTFAQAEFVGDVAGRVLERCIGC